MKHTTILAVAALALVPGLVFAQTKTFKVGKSAGLVASQTVTFDSTAQFENFTGITHSVDGTVTIDAKAKKAKGSVTVDLSTLDTGIPARNEHMSGAMWLNTAKYPNAVFTLKTVKQKSKDVWTVAGSMSLHGVTKALKTDVTIRYFPESDSTRKARFKGDVLQVKTAFPITLKDYGIIVPEAGASKVAGTVQVKVTLYGVTG